MWQIQKLGLIDYQEALELQLELVDKKQQGLKDNFFLLCEHPPVFTRGKGSKENNILNKNNPVIMTNRGGDLTYHEPGQLIGYIIFDLKAEKYNVKTYLDKIEQLIINTLAKMDIQAQKHHELVGVWVGDKKIASIGIGIKKGITMHGFALNINNDLGGFSSINPCGLHSSVMTSVKKIKGKEFPLTEIQDIMISEFDKISL